MTDQIVVNDADDRYCNLLRRILGGGMDMPSRTGIGRRSLFGPQLHFCNIAEEFPILTTKRIWFRAVTEELLWFLRGATNIKPLQEKKITIWNEWAEENGNVGPIYGYQWRSWDADPFTHDPGHDQLAYVIQEIKSNPWSRRLIVSAWNVAQIEDMALPPCHLLFQFQVTPAVANPQDLLDPKPALLNCHMYMRSADVFLGVPFNIASYALLLRMVAQVTGLTADNLIISFGDVHIYHNHFEQVQEQLTRSPFVAPKLILSPLTDIDAFTAKDILLENYLSHPAIKAPVAV